ncbi:MAG TPA: carbohydrate ABC transporter permease [Mycobacteriales bacterium]|nr:carbohydrate ABC transporter permease [Mycobacteriales bacterium]
MTSTTADTRREPEQRNGRTIYLTVGIVLSVLFVLPLLWAVLRSFQPAGLITQAPQGKDFSHLTVANYSGLIGGSIHILRYVGNSLIVSIGTALLTAVVATLAGYGFGRFRFRGAGVIFALIIVVLMIPFQAVLTPLFMELNALHLTDSRLGLVLFYTTFNLPFGVFVMRNTFAQIPKELEDSAYVDGATVMGTLFFVLRPLVVPGIATTVLYAFLFSWTEFLGALTFITKDSLITLPVALLNVETGTYGQVNFGYLVSGAVIAMIPCIVLYVALQRYYVRGLTSGAVKG